MIDPLSRRDWLKAVGAAGAGALVPPPVNPGRKPGAAQILPLTSTSDVFVPPRGRAFMKFSFDFPEPSVEFAGLRFGFLVFTRENTYALDASTMTADATGDAVAIKATGLTWAGGQVKAAGGVDARLQQDGDVVLCDVTVHMDQPIKAV